MDLRKLAAFLIGAWLTGSIFMTMVATRNFRSVEWFLASPGTAAPMVNQLGRDSARALLRRNAAELNGMYFKGWEMAQLAIGAGLIATLVTIPGPKRLRIALAGVMLALVMVMHWGITPEVIKLGRMIDAVPAAEAAPLQARFWRFHAAYSSLELAKLAMSAVLAFALLRRDS